MLNSTLPWQEPNSFSLPTLQISSLIPYLGEWQHHPRSCPNHKSDPSVTLSPCSNDTHVSPQPLLSFPLLLLWFEFKPWSTQLLSHSAYHQSCHSLIRPFIHPQHNYEVFANIQALCCKCGPLGEHCKAGLCAPETTRRPAPKCDPAFPCSGSFRRLSRFRAVSAFLEWFGMAYGRSCSSPQGKLDCSWTQSHPECKPSSSRLPCSQGGGRVTRFWLMTCKTT